MGKGVFNQTGGVNNLVESTFGASLVLGNTVGSTGIYNLSAGTISVADQETIGLQGIGTMNQTGGANRATSIQVGGLNSGTYILSGGTLISNSDCFLGGNNAASGTVINSGGVHITRYLYFGAGGDGSSGTYLLSGGGVLQTQQIEMGGSSGTDELIQSGGVHTSTNEVRIGLSQAYLMLGGTFNGNALTLLSLPGTGTSPTYTQTGGSVSLAQLNNGSLTQYNNTPGGSFTLTGGRFTVTNAFLVGGTTAVQSGASFNATDLQMVDGFVSVGDG